MSVTATLAGVSRTPSSLRKGMEFLNLRWTAVGDASAGTVGTGAVGLLSSNYISQNDVVYWQDADFWLDSTTLINVYFYVGVGTWETYIFGNTGETPVLAINQSGLITPANQGVHLNPARYSNIPLLLGKPVTSGQIGINASTNENAKNYVFRVRFIVLKDYAIQSQSIPVDVPSVGKRTFINDSGSIIGKIQ